MRCKDCPGYKVDGFAHCLIVFPLKPKQLMDENEEANYCQMYEKYKVFAEEAEKQTEESDRFDPDDYFKSPEN